MIGYMNGLALTILVGQLPKLFGFSVEGDSFIAELRGFAKGVGNGETVRRGPRRRPVRVGVDRGVPAVVAKGPGVLAAVVLSIVAASVFDLADHGVSLVGTLPRGFPPFTIPHVAFSDLGLLVAGAFGIAVVSLADTISTASSFAARSGDEIDGSREMIGIGAANIAAGLFQGFPGLHQRLANRGGRTGRRQDPGHRVGRRASPSP